MFLSFAVIPSFFSLINLNDGNIVPLFLAQSGNNKSSKLKLIFYFRDKCKFSPKKNNIWRKILREMVGKFANLTINFIVSLLILIEFTFLFCC